MHSHPGPLQNILLLMCPLGPPGSLAWLVFPLGTQTDTWPNRQVPRPQFSLEQALPPRQSYDRFELEYVPADLPAFHF